MGAPVMISTAWRGPTVPGEALAGAHFADDLQLAGNVGGADGVSIAHRAGDGRRIAIRGDVFGQHASRRGHEGNLFDGGSGTRATHGADHGFARFGKRQRSHSTILIR